MDENKLIFEIWQKYGVNGLLSVMGFIMFWKHYLEPKKEEKDIERKKAEGTWVSWESLNERMDSLKNDMARQRDDLTNLANRYSDHMKTEEKEEARFAILENNNAHFVKDYDDIKEVLKEMRATQQEAFRLISEIRSYQLERKP